MNEKNKSPTSPKKSLEGVLGGILSTVVCVLIIAAFWNLAILDENSYIPADETSLTPPVLERQQKIVCADDLLKTVYKNYNDSFFAASRPNDCRNRFLLSMFREEMLLRIKSFFQR